MHIVNSMYIYISHVPVESGESAEFPPIQALYRILVFFDSLESLIIRNIEEQPIEIYSLVTRL